MKNGEGGVEKMGFWDDEGENFFVKKKNLILDNLYRWLIGYFILKGANLDQ